MDEKALAEQRKTERGFRGLGWDGKRDNRGGVSEGIAY